jgi:tetratricopeptide (TPR) repeat protein
MSPRQEKIYRTAILFLLVLVLASAFAAGLRTVSDTDMGWHLATGRYVVQHHTIPSTDVLSYTASGTTWRYPPFAGVLLYLVYLAGGYAGLSWFCALACVATVAFLMRRRDLASIALAMCAVEPIAFRTGPRADLFNTVLFAALLALLWDFKCGRTVRLWLVPAIMLVWVNVHPGFVLGLAVIAAYLLLEAGDLLFSQRRAASLQRLRTSWPWLLAGAGITLINPWGPKIYGTSLSLAGLRAQSAGTLSTSATIGEFLSVPLSSHFLARLFEFRHPENGFSWLVIVAAVVIALAMWGKQYSLALIEAAALYLSMLHARYIAFFCIATVVFGATVLRDFIRRDTNPRLRWRVPFPAAMVFLAAIAAVTVLHTVDFIGNRNYVVFAADTRFGVGEASWLPERAASFVRREHLPGNVFEEFGVGGFAAWRLGPEYPDFIDGRFDHLSPSIFALEQKLTSQPPDSQTWDYAANRWGINTLLISEAGSRAVNRQNALAFCRSAKWRPVYMDEVSMVLLRNTEANRPLIERLGIDCTTLKFTPPSTSSRKGRYDFLMNSGGMLYALSRDGEAITALQQAATLYPYDPNAELLMGELALRERDAPGAERHLRASLDRNESDRALYELGRLYTLEGRFGDAAEAFRRAANLAVSPYIPYMSLGQVELALQHPQLALDAFDHAVKSSPYRGAESVAPEFYAQIAAGRGEAYRLSGNLQQAIAFQEEAVRLTPSAAGRWERLSELLQAAGQRDRAQQAREKARELKDSVER